MKKYKHFAEACKRVDELKKQGFKILHADTEFEHASKGYFVLIHVFSEKNEMPYGVFNLSDDYLDINNIYTLCYIYE